LQLRWQRRVPVERRVLKIGKGINGSWGFATGPFACRFGRLQTLFYFWYTKGLIPNPPNRSPSMAKHLPRCRPEPAKPGDRESRRKKTSPQAAVLGDLAGNTSNALEALLFTVGFEIFDRYSLPPINRRGPTPLHAHCQSPPRFSLVIFSSVASAFASCESLQRKPQSIREVSFPSGSNTCFRFSVFGVMRLSSRF
jgi:hypothetical protein